MTLLVSIDGRCVRLFSSFESPELSSSSSSSEKKSCFLKLVDEGEVVRLINYTNDFLGRTISSLPSAISHCTFALLIHLSTSQGRIETGLTIVHLT